MAEAVAFTLGGKILSAAASPAFKKAYEKGVSIWEAKDDLVKLQVSVETIQAVLLDAERKQESSVAVRNWIKRIKSVLYDAEDLFDEFATEDLIKQQMVEGNEELSLWMKVLLFCSKLNPVISRNSIAKKVKDIRERLAEISIDMNQFEKCLVEKPVYNMGRGEDRGCFVDAKSVIGRDEDKRVMLDRIINELDSARSDNPIVLVIVGIGGMGKTTLAQLIFNDEKIRSTFQNKWFACISDVTDERKVLGKIFQSIKGVSYSDLDVGQLQTKIRESVENQKFLLVLDDVWEEDRARWQDRMSLLNGCARESRILVTTRFLSVAEAVGALRPHNLEGLSKHDAWSLFKNKAFREGYENDTRREILGKQILKKCSGVPLAIQSIGSLLYKKNTIEEWEAIEKVDLLVLGRKHTDETMRVLKLSYDHLPSNLKQCFAYCCLFPKYYRYNKRELIYHWISQGYINFDDEETGFMHLFRMGFFQEEKKDEFGAISSCKMHDIMHDLALHVIGEEGEFGTSSSVSIFTRHVSLIVDGGEGGSWNIPPPLLNVKSIRSCMLRMLSSNKDIQPALNQLCSNFKWLRTLTLSELGIKHIPPSIGELKLVKYLDISHNDFEELPDSITSLVNLLALNLEGCQSLEVLPRNFKNLIKLSFLELTATISSMPEGVAGMDNLRYLSHFVVRNWSEVDGLNKLLERVRGRLIIKFDTEKEVEHEEKWQLPANISLQDIHISCYTGHGIGGWRNSVSEIRLEYLEIENCKNVKHIPSVSRLPVLKFLRLRELPELEFIEEEEEVDTHNPATMHKFFPCLKDLALRNLPKLKGWQRNLASETTSTSSKSGFPGKALASLEYLRIERCSSLTSLHLASPRLREIVVEDCDELKSIELDQSQSIRSLNISNCDKLKSIELDQSQSIRSLNIRYCTQLESLHIQALALAGMEEIKIYGCRDLKLLNTQDKSLSVLRSEDSVLLERSPSLLLTSSLKEIDIRKCKWEISLRCLELTSLESCYLSDIYGLQSLHIPSPHLEEIHLNNCVGLTSVEVEAPARIAIFGCSELKNFCVAHPDAVQTLIIDAPVDWGSISNFAECSRLAEICLRNDVGGFVERLLSSPASASLKRFSIWNAHGLKSLIIKSPHLEEITIANWLIGLPGKALASLEYLDISGCSSLTSLCLASPRLRKIVVKFCDELKSIELDQSQSNYSLYIRNCIQLKSVHIEALALAEMEEIEIVGCHRGKKCVKLLNTQDKSLSVPQSVDSVLLERSPSLLRMSSLKNINISECKWEISLRCLELPSLETCDLSGIYGLQSLHIPSPHLKHIELEDCVGLTSVEVEAPTEITISDCSELKNFRISHPAAVQSLSIDTKSSVDWGSISNLAECSRLARIWLYRVGGGFVERLLSSPASASLKRFSISYAHGLKSLIINSPHLEDIEISNCKELTSVELESPHLKNISISNCKELTSVELESPHLENISISNCKELTSVELESPHLENISISNCNELTSAELESPSLPHHPKNSIISLAYCSRLKNVRIPRPIVLHTLKIVACPELSLNTGVDWGALTNLISLRLYPLPPPEELPQCLLQRRDFGRLHITDAYNLWDT